MNTEQTRLAEANEQKSPWKKWGPYLSERQSGTVREDYSENGDAWNFFTHDHARSRIAGAKTASPAFLMTNSSSVSLWPCGTGNA